MRAEALKDLLRVLPRDSPARVGARTRAWARCFECAEVRAFVRACVRDPPAAGATTGPSSTGSDQKTDGDKIHKYNKDPIPGACRMKWGKRRGNKKEERRKKNRKVPLGEEAGQQARAPNWFEKVFLHSPASSLTPPPFEDQTPAGPSRRQMRPQKPRNTRLASLP